MRFFSSVQTVIGIALCSVCAIAFAGTPDDTKFEKIITVPMSGESTSKLSESVTLRKCGEADMQVYGFIDIGDVALYAKDCDRKPLYEGMKDHEDQAIALLFYYRRGFSASDLADTAQKTLKKGLSPDRFGALLPELTVFHRYYRDVQPGDRYFILLNRDEMGLYFNNEMLGRSQSSLLIDNYFSIWLGAEPVSRAIKHQLLRS